MVFNFGCQFIFDKRNIWPEVSKCGFLTNFKMTLNIKKLTLPRKIEVSHIHVAFNSSTSVFVRSFGQVNRKQSLRFIKINISQKCSINYTN